MIHHNSMHEWVLILIPLVISLIYFVSRLVDRRETGEKASTIDNIIYAILAINILYAAEEWLGAKGASDLTQTILLTAYNIVEYIFTFFFLKYALESIDARERYAKKVNRASFVGMIIATGILVACLPTGLCFTVIKGELVRGSIYPIIMVYPTLCSVFGVLYLIPNKHVDKRTKLAFLMYCVIEMGCMGIQLKYKGLSLSSLSLALILIILYTNVYAQRNMALARAEKQLAEESLKRMQMQMRPHFMYNTLSSIQELCVFSPKDAEAAIGDFTEFLRGNMDNMDKAEPVPFAYELELTKHYVNLEKYRFEDRISVEYDIQETNFLIPAVTLQPIVENAIRYGLCSTFEGGQLKISSKRIDDENIIIVEDNGAGFDKESSQSDERSHIGMANVRKRLELMCGGRLEIESVVGQGTKATIVIPVETDTDTDK